MNVFIRSQGCPRRQLDASRLASYFAANGCVLAGGPEEADYIIFVSCAYVGSMEKAAWETIEELQRYPGELIVLGCLPGIARGFARRFKGRYFATKDLDGIDRVFPGFRTRFRDVPDTGSAYPAGGGPSVERVRGILRKFSRGAPFFRRRLAPACKPRGKVAYLRVSRGCVENCSYCGVRRAIGRLRSKPLRVCIEEYRKLLAKGYRKFIIVADNTGAYGQDIRSTFAELLEKLSAASGSLRVRWHLEQMHPRWMLRYEGVIAKMVREKKIRRISCALQSGSDRILKLMNRGYTAGEITGLLLRLRECLPGLKLRTEMIAGFPSETHKDFAATMSALRKTGFDYVFVYPYSDVRGTKASALGDKIDSRTISRRMRAVKDLIRRKGMSGDFLNDW